MPGSVVLSQRTFPRLHIVINHGKLDQHDRHLFHLHHAHLVGGAAGQVHEYRRAHSLWILVVSSVATFMVTVVRLELSNMVTLFSSKLVRLASSLIHNIS